LVLDRNGDGIVNDGKELFGNVTPLSDTSDGPRTGRVNDFETT
jgi:hypothetical protein